MAANHNQVAIDRFGLSRDFCFGSAGHQMAMAIRHTDLFAQTIKLFSRLSVDFFLNGRKIHWNVTAIGNGQRLDDVEGRDRAKDLGLRVTLRPVPAVPARFRFAPERDLACYQQIQSRSKSELGEHRAYVFAEGHWQPTQGASTAPAWLTMLPSGATLVEVSDRYLSIFWDEREGLEGLETIRQAIDSR